MNLLGICRNATLIQQTDPLKSSHSIECMVYVSFVGHFLAKENDFILHALSILFLLIFFPAFFRSSSILLCLTYYYMCFWTMGGGSLLYVLLVCFWYVCGPYTLPILWILSFMWYFFWSALINWQLNIEYSDTMWPKRWFIKQSIARMHTLIIKV